MTISDLIKIGHEIIYISGFYKNYNKSEKIKIQKKFLSYKNKLDSNNDKYSKKLVSFLDDLLGDLKKNKPLQIDKIFEDDYVGNYYNTKKQVGIYNNLIDKKNYENIVSQKKSEKNNLFLGEIYNNFKNKYNKLDLSFISSSLLIFTIFDYKSPKNLLIRLYNFRKIYKFSRESVEKIEKMLLAYELFLKEVYKFGIQNLKNNTINYKYIKASKNKTNENISINFILKDASKEKGRTGFYRDEYIEILRKLV